jgi:hypothetical protein
MELIPLLGLDLKSDLITDFVENNDAHVSYEFDRLHEGTPDEYIATFPKLGLQLVFNEEQQLKTIFIHIEKEEEFEPANLEDTEITKFGSKTNALSFAKQNKIITTEGNAELFGIERDWVRFEYNNHSIHYEFRDGKLGLVTLQVKNA